MTSWPTLQSMVLSVMRGWAAGSHAASVDVNAMGSGLAEHKPPCLPEAGGSTLLGEESFAEERLDTSESFCGHVASDRASPCALCS